MRRFLQRRKRLPIASPTLDCGLRERLGIHTVNAFPMNTAIAGEYRDRKAGLLVFGILEIVLGALFLLMVPLMILSLVVASRHAGPSVAPQAMVAAMGPYALAATVLIWLGIGSILGRRWARALWVCLSGIGLGVGVIACPFVFYLFSDLPTQPGQPALPPAALLATRIIMISVMLLFYIIIPGALFLFYRSPHVKHTCEVRDPKDRWTDRCPLPVLALSLFTVFGGLGMLQLLAFRGVFPLFGVLATGAAGYSLILFVSGTLLYLGWGIFRLKNHAWWLLLVVMSCMGASSALTFSHVDFAGLCIAMGMDGQMATTDGQMAMIRWIGPVSILPWLVWLLSVRRHFSRKVSTA
jgi:MFS family permease